MWILYSQKLNWDAFSIIFFGQYLAIFENYNMKCHLSILLWWDVICYRSNQNIFHTGFWCIDFILILGPSIKNFQHYVPAPFRWKLCNASCEEMDYLFWEETFQNVNNFVKVQFSNMKCIYLRIDTSAI